MPKIRLEDYMENEDKYLYPEPKKVKGKTKILKFNEWRDDQYHSKENKKKKNIKVKKQRNAKNSEKDI